MQPSVPPPVIALKPPAPSVATPKPVRPAAEGDLSSYIEAKRRARAEQQAAASVASPQAAPAPEDEGARRDRIAAANLALPPAQAFGYDPKRRGGAFQLRRVGVDDAEFIFFGWDKNVGRSRPQMFEVRRGDNPDIQLAVVRRIIAIIREFEQGDFRWHSSRTSSSVILSARASDNAQLEQFMMEEFFPGRSVR
jgi:hypothetical protein